MSEETRRCLDEIGGRRGRRVFDSSTAREMVRLREAHRAFRRFHAQCFWSCPSDYRVAAADIEWVAKRLMTFGGREGWVKGAKLLR